MSVTAVDLDLERKKRSQDNGDLTPHDLLRVALADIEGGEYPRAKKCLILIIDEDDQRRLYLHPYRSDMTRTEEVAFLEIWKQDRIADWRT